jgi:hypothetical protein
VKTDDLVQAQYPSVQQPGVVVVLYDSFKPFVLHGRDDSREDVREDKSRKKGQIEYDRPEGGKSGSAAVEETPMDVKKGTRGRTASTNPLMGADIKISSAFSNAIVGVFKSVLPCNAKRRG